MDGTGGLGKPVTLLARRPADAVVTGWKLRGGPGDPLAASGWKPLGAARRLQRPGLLPHDVRRRAARRVGPHPIWRVVTTGLGHGSVWVNGHNLGRYPEKIPINGLYVPECWLQAGKNSLVIYDEDGKRPDQVTVAAETAASRDIAVQPGTLCSPSSLAAPFSVPPLPLPPRVGGVGARG